MKKTTLLVTPVLLALHGAFYAGGARALDTAAAPVVDYSRRLQPLDPSLRAKLVGRWTSEVDKLVIEIASVDLASGQVRGRVTPTTGPAASNGHELIGWISAAPPRDKFDNVIPITFSTTLYEYGTLPVWAGFVRDDKIVTMMTLVWPSKPYSWDHISTFQTTWTRLP